MLLMIDNYDSFTYNLVQYFAELGADVVVHRNDEISVAQIAALNPQHIVVSPGPCTPNEAGVSVAAIQQFAGKIKNAIAGTPLSVDLIAAIACQETGYFEPLLRLLRSWSATAEIHHDPELAALFAEEEAGPPVPLSRPVPRSRARRGA